MAKSKSRRPKLTAAVIREVAARSGGVCECCGTSIRVDRHHILEFNKGGPGSLDNLIALCPNCHRQIPQFLSKAQQKELQGWHIRGHSKTGGQNHAETTPRPCFFGPFPLAGVGVMLMIDEQKTVSLYTRASRHYVNIIMLDGFAPQLIVLENRVMINDSNLHIHSAGDDFSVFDPNTQEYVYYLRSDDAHTRIGMHFTYKGELLHFDESKAILGTNTMGPMTLAGNGEAAIRYDSAGFSASRP